MNRPQFSAPMIALVAFLAFGSGMSAYGQVPDQGSDAAALYAQFVEAQNVGNVATQLGLLTDDATIVSGFGATLCPPPAGCAGKAAIQQELARRVASGVQTSTPQTHLDGDTATARNEVRNPVTEAAGIERAIVILTIVERGGKIASIESHLDTTDAQTASVLDALRVPSAPAPAQIAPDAQQP